MLTPIRVRGKKGARKASTYGTSRASFHPKKHVKQVDERTRIEPITPRRTLSRLETLPVELIEKIFLYCLEMNLPRSSPSVAAALTSERIYRILILISFFDDDTAALHEEVATPSDILKLFRPLDYRPLGFEERKKLQTAVLDCRWCTLDRIERQIPSLLELTLHRYWFGRHIVMEESDKAELNNIIRGNTQLSCDFEGRDTENHNNPYELSIKSPFKLVVIDLDFVDTPDAWLQWYYRPVSVLHFPNKLLRGNPWTEEKVSFLEFLSKAYGHGETKDNFTLSFHTAHEGIHDAIVEQNPLALRHLLRLDELFNWAKNFGTRKGCLYRLPAEHFRTAVRHSGNDSEILKLLIRGSAESIPSDDPEITAWASEARDRGDRFAEWLLDFMLMLPNIVAERSSEDYIYDISTGPLNLFVNGSLNRISPSPCNIRVIRSVFGDLEDWVEELDIS